MSTLLRALEWVAANHVAPALVHMSVEGGFSADVNRAIERLVNVHHVHVVASSGRWHGGRLGFDPCHSVGFCLQVLKNCTCFYVAPASVCIVPRC